MSDLNLLDRLRSRLQGNRANTPQVEGANEARQAAIDPALLDSMDLSDLTPEAVSNILRVNRLKQKTLAADKSSSVFRSAVFWINGIMTGLYACVVAARWFIPLFGSPESLRDYALITAVMAFCAVVILTVLDIARWGWDQMAIADSSTGPQRGLAKIMALLNFGGSTLASYLATKFLVGMVMQQEVASYATSAESFLSLITWSLMVNICAVYLFSMLSLESRMLGKIAEKATNQSEAIMGSIDVVMQGTDTRAAQQFIQSGSKVRAVLANTGAVHGERPAKPTKTPNEFVIFDNEPVLHGVNGNHSQNGTTPPPPPPTEGNG